MTFGFWHLKLYNEVVKYLIGLIALLLPTYLIRFSVFGVPLTLLELIIYAVFIIGFMRLGYVHLLKCKRNVWLLVGLLFLAALISVFVAPEKTVALGQFKALFLDSILVFFLIVCFLEPKDIKWTIYGLTLSSVFVSIYSIIQQITGNMTVDGRVIGIFGYNPNYVALYLAPITVLLIAYSWQLMTQRQLQRALPFLVAVLINFYGLYLTGSRAGILATAAGLGFFLILHFWSKIRAKLVYKVGLAILIIATILGAWFLFRPDFTASSGRVVSSNNVRWQIWQTSVEMIKNQPIFGVGLGNYQNAFSTLTKNRVNFNEYISPLALSPHNVFLMFYLTTGLLGFLVFIWLLITFYRIGFSEFKSDWSKILLGGMTTLILQGLVDTPYFKNDLVLIFWLIFGFMILLKKKVLK